MLNPETLLSHEMTLEYKAVLTTSIVVDIDSEEHGSSPRMEMIIRKLLDTIDLFRITASHTGSLDCSVRP